MLAIGCGGDDTEASIDAVVSDEPPGLPEPLDRIRLTVSVLAASGELVVRTEEHTPESRAGRLVPWSVRVMPRSASDVGRTLYRIRAVGVRSGVEVVSTQHRLVFVPGRRLVLSLRLDADCLGTTCGADQTCRDATCTDDFVPACSLVEGARPAECRDGDEMDAATTRDASATADSGTNGTDATSIDDAAAGDAARSGDATSLEDAGADVGALDASPILDAAAADVRGPDGGADAPDASPPPCTPDGCDDDDPCTDDACTPTGCTNTFNTDDCDDGVFCNGRDRCAGGRCTTHDGDPCGGSAVCDETMGRCVGCLIDDDCGPPIPGDWGPCVDLASTCDEDGNEYRDLTPQTCAGGSCRGGPVVVEARPCFRPTEGAVCAGAGSTCRNGVCCGDGTCSIGENGTSCPGDCCDATTPCGATRTGDPGRYCRNMNGAGYAWVTEAEVGVLCDSLSEVCATTYRCAAMSGFCVIEDGVFTYRDGPCVTTCGNGFCEPGENGGTCGSDCCDASTSCGATYRGMGELYCRRFNSGPYEWITAADALASYCSVPAHSGNTYACVGETGFCCSPGVFAPVCS